MAHGSRRLNEEGIEECDQPGGCGCADALRWTALQSAGQPHGVRTAHRWLTHDRPVYPEAEAPDCSTQALVRRPAAHEPRATDDVYIIALWCLLPSLMTQTHTRVCLRASSRPPAASFTVTHTLQPAASTLRPGHGAHGSLYLCACSAFTATGRQPDAHIPHAHAHIHAPPPIVHASPRPPAPGSFALLTETQRHGSTISCERARDRSSSHPVPRPASWFCRRAVPVVGALRALGAARRLPRLALALWLGSGMYMFWQN